MAKLSLINRDQKRRALVKKYAKKRETLEAILANPKASEEVRYAARLKIQQLPRNANPTRLRNRCALTGRSRGFFRKFGLSRNKLREFAMHRCNNRKRVRRAIEEIWIAKRDVLRARGNLLANIIKHNFAFDYADRAVINRHDRAVAA